MRYVAVSFTLKEQSFTAIQRILSLISDRVDGKSGKTVLVHGFMPREEVINKKFSLDVLDKLSELFPVQINCYQNGKPNRVLMASILKETKGEVYIVGSIIDGVAEERDLYKAAGVEVYSLSLDFSGVIYSIPRLNKYGQITRPITGISYKNEDSTTQFLPATTLSKINKINSLSSELISALRDMKTETRDKEQQEEYATAIERAHESCMWGTKACMRDV